MPDDQAWLFDLISDDAAVRTSATARVRRDFGQRSVPGGSGSAPWTRDPHYQVLFLRWEALAPQDWWEAGGPGGRFHTKAWILESLRTSVPPPALIMTLEALIIGAVRRPHRAGDCGYWRLARLLDGPRLRSALSEATDAASEGTRLRAGFLLFLLLHPAAQPGSRGWQRWRRDHGRRFSSPRSAAGLAALSPDRAAGLLADLGPAQLAFVLEGLRYDHAARILARLAGRPVAAEALGRMDARIGGRLLRLMPPHVGAGLLAALEPRVAGPLFPVPWRYESGLLDALPPGLDGRLLPWMRPGIAETMLGRWPAAETATLLLAGDRGRVARLLSDAGTDATVRVLRMMPAEAAAAVLDRIEPSWLRELVRERLGTR